MPVLGEECTSSLRNVPASPLQSPPAAVDRATDQNFTNTCEQFAWRNEERTEICSSARQPPKSDFNPPNESSLAKTARHLSAHITNRCCRSAASPHTALRLRPLPNLLTLEQFQWFLCLAIFCEKHRSTRWKTSTGKFLRQKTFSRPPLFNAGTPVCHFTITSP